MCCVVFMLLILKCSVSWLWLKLFPTILHVTDNLVLKSYLSFDCHWCRQLLQDFTLNFFAGFYFTVLNRIGHMLSRIDNSIAWQYYPSGAAVDTARPGVKVSRNAPERHSGARKFKPGACRLQNYWISQPEPMFLGPAS